MHCRLPSAVCRLPSAAPIVILAADTCQSRPTFCALSAPRSRAAQFLEGYGSTLVNLEISVSLLILNRETGPPETISDLAAANGVNASCFAHVLRFAYLAPDIIEAIIEGWRPPELTANKLVRLKNLPIGWVDQREYLGLPAD